MMKRVKIKNSSGDTIVEVMIVLAVLSLAFAISYSTATHALSVSRNAQEHSQALGVLNTQIEQTRKAFAKDISLPTNTAFCMTGATTFEPGFAAGVPADSLRSDTLTNYPSACVSGLYSISVKYVAQTPVEKSYYDYKVRWNGVGGLGKQQVENTYKINKLLRDVNSGTPVTSSPPSVSVTVKKIHQNNDNTTPSCSNPANDNIGGTSLVLKKVGDPSWLKYGTTTDAGSTYTFSDGFTDESGSYFVTVNGIPSAADPLNGRYELCAPNATNPPVTSSAVVANPGQTTPINTIKIRPVCTVRQGQTDPYDHYTAAYDHNDFVGWAHDVVTPAYYEATSVVQWWHDGGTRTGGIYTDGRYNTSVTPEDHYYGWGSPPYYVKLAYRSDIAANKDGWYFFEAWTAHLVPGTPIYHEAVYGPWYPVYNHNPYKDYLGNYRDTFNYNACP